MKNVVNRVHPTLPSPLLFDKKNEFICKVTREVVGGAEGP
jgi:hypothetical protein